MLAPESCTDLESFVARALSRLAAELRLVDIGDYIAYLRMERYSCVADIVHNAADFYFTPGFVEFAMDGETTADWGRSPEVTLRLVINSARGIAHVAMRLCDHHAEVKLDFVDYHESLRHRLDRGELLASDIAGNMIGFSAAVLPPAGTGAGLRPLGD